MRTSERSKKKRRRINNTVPTIPIKHSACHSVQHTMKQIVQNMYIIVEDRDEKILEGNNYVLFSRMPFTISLKTHPFCVIGLAMDTSVRKSFDITCKCLKATATCFVGNYFTNEFCLGFIATYRTDNYPYTYIQCRDR